MYFPTISLIQSNITTLERLLPLSCDNIIKYRAVTLQKGCKHHGDNLHILETIIIQPNIKKLTDSPQPQGFHQLKSVYYIVLDASFRYKCAFQNPQASSQLSYIRAFNWWPEVYLSNTLYSFWIQFTCKYYYRISALILSCIKE